ncbi:MAG: ATP-dependent Clp protease adapter ClpS [Porticoccus sp.]|jgi:ATP-dependent Clp protease adaptor protein ClpS|nr:ATP-dependent Clp protease adapter ClpS [Porticoccus sp.]
MIRLDNKDSEEESDYNSGSTSILEEKKPKLKKPPLYAIIIFNDDYTPMEFVVTLLKQVFSMNYDAATRIMLKVHTEGKAVCAIYIRDVAETKAQQVRELARDNEHPLKCEIEPVND